MAIETAEDAAGEANWGEWSGVVIWDFGGTF